MRKLRSVACIGTVTWVAALGCGGSQPNANSAPPPATTTSAVTQAAPPAVVRGAQKPAYPVATKKPVTTGYGALNATDDYQWMEPNADPAVKEWVAAENALTRSVLDAIPNRAAVHARVLALQGGRTASYGDLDPRGKVIFAQKRQPPKQQPFLVALTSLDDTKSERVVVDPNALDATGKTTIDFYAPSLDGKLVAVSLSEGGSEKGASTSSTSRPASRGRTSSPSPSAAPAAARSPGTKTAPAFGTRVTRTRASAPTPTSIFISRSISTSSERRSTRTSTPSAKTRRGSPSSSSRRATTASWSSPS